MDYKKELLLFVATTFVSAGAVKIGNNSLEGGILLIIGGIVFALRGYYKLKIK